MAPEGEPLALANQGARGGTVHIAEAPPMPGAGGDNNSVVVEDGLDD